MHHNCQRSQYETMYWVYFICKLLCIWLADIIDICWTNQLLKRLHQHLIVLLQDVVLDIPQWTPDSLLSVKLAVLSCFQATLLAKHMARPHCPLWQMSVDNPYHRKNMDPWLPWTDWMPDSSEQFIGWQWSGYLDEQLQQHKVPR